VDGRDVFCAAVTGVMGVVCFVENGRVGRGWAWVGSSVRRAWAAVTGEDGERIWPWLDWACVWSRCFPMAMVQTGLVQSSVWAWSKSCWAVWRGVWLCSGKWRAVLIPVLSGGG